MARVKNLLMVTLVVLISGRVALAAPASDGTLFLDDFSSGDLRNWTTGVANSGVAEYQAAGNGNPGRFHVLLATGDEAFGRPKLRYPDSRRTRAATRPNGTQPAPPPGVAQ